MVCVFYMDKKKFSLRYEAFFYNTPYEINLAFKKLAFKNSYRISMEFMIASNDFHLFTDSLSNYYPVERIAVMQR